MPETIRRDYRRDPARCRWCGATEELRTATERNTYWWCDEYHCDEVHYARCVDEDACRERRKALPKPPRRNPWREADARLGPVR